MGFLESNDAVFTVGMFTTENAGLMQCKQSYTLQKSGVAKKWQD